MECFTRLYYREVRARERNFYSSIRRRGVGLFKPCSSSPSLISLDDDDDDDDNDDDDKTISLNRTISCTSLLANRSSSRSLKESFTLSAIFLNSSADIAPPPPPPLLLLLFPLPLTNSFTDQLGPREDKLSCCRASSRTAPAAFASSSNDDVEKKKRTLGDERLCSLRRCVSPLLLRARE